VKTRGFIIIGGVFMNFQDMILALQRYWAKQGCIMMQPYDVEKGAGTMNPNTFLRSLGPEPWIQQLYLDSLKAIGIDPLVHDIRFVEDNWEAATMGAWGLGWEVWLDGMEITQFTYFQQVGNVECELETGEITYGLERLAMYIQEVDSVYDIKWNDEIAYGEVFKKAEFENSVYAFEKCDIDMLFNLFDTYEKEALRLMDEGLVIPSYDYVLKCSHAFNTLDARGAIGVSQRASWQR